MFKLFNCKTINNQKRKGIQICRIIMEITLTIAIPHILLRTHYNQTNIRDINLIPVGFSLITIPRLRFKKLQKKIFKINLVIDLK